MKMKMKNHIDTTEIDLGPTDMDTNIVNIKKCQYDDAYMY